MVVMPQNQDETIYMTETQYLEFESQADRRYEFANGQVYAMTGGSIRHNTIVANINTSLNIQLRTKDCIAPDSNTRIAVQSKTVSYCYPDVTVICGEPQLYHDRVDTVINPIVLVEVLSRSTQIIDRNDKLEEYLKIETLREYLIISQDQAKAELYYRGSDGEWKFKLTKGEGATITLPSIACELSLVDVYLKIEFDSESDQETSD